MNINLDEKKIKNIVYVTRNGRPVNLVLKNGELVDITDIPVKYKTDIERENAWVKDTLDASREKKELHDYKPIACLDDNTQTTLESSRKKEWIDSVRENEIKVSNFEYVNLDEKYNDLTHEEKMQISKQIIDNDAKEDKNKVESSIGDNKPLSEEVSKYPKRNFLKDSEFIDNELEKCKKNTE